VISRATELQKYRRRLQPAEKASSPPEIAQGLGAWAEQRRQPSYSKPIGSSAASAAVSAGPSRASKPGSLVARHDQQTAQQLAPNGTPGPRICARELIGPKLAAADCPRPARLAQSWHNWFSADDAQLIALHVHREAHRGSLIQVLGISTAKTGTGTLRRLLPPGWLPARKRTAPASMGNGIGRYRVVSEPLPDGVSSQQLERAWTDQLSQKNSPT